MVRCQATIAPVLGADDVEIDGLEAGRQTLTVVWVTESGEDACAQDSITIWIVPLRLQVVRVPWGASVGRPLFQQPWVAIELLVHAGRTPRILSAMSCADMNRDTTRR